MAKVVAAVDLARVRVPVHIEEESVDMAANQPSPGGWTRVQADHITAQELRPEATLPLPQVRQASDRTTKRFDQIRRGRTSQGS